jgi:L-threonylcarbamoyladenylate synthase
VIVDVDTAVAKLRAGEVVAYPTETVYGLGVDARDPAAVERLNALKGRPPGAGLSVLVSGLDMLRVWAPELPARALALARRHWPGPLTLVVPVPAGLLPAVVTELGVGFRCSPHPTAALLVERLAAPIVSTSANRAGAEPGVTAEHVQHIFGPDLAIVGGGAAGGRPVSTVVAVGADGELAILRSGAIPAENLI